VQLAATWAAERSALVTARQMLPETRSRHVHRLVSPTVLTRFTSSSLVPCQPEHATRLAHETGGQVEPDPGQEQVARTSPAA